ncbi:hypothetical protein COOONC_13604 [Cooperia oncophora]
MIVAHNNTQLATTKTRGERFILKQDFSKADFQLINQYLSSVDWVGLGCEHMPSTKMSVRFSRNEILELVTKWRNSSSVTLDSIPFTFIKRSPKTFHDH